MWVQGVRIQLNAAEWPIQRNVCPLERCLETTYSASKVGQHRGHVAPHDKGLGNGIPDPATMAQDTTDAKRAPRDPGATMGAQVEKTP